MFDTLDRGLQQLLAGDLGHGAYEKLSFLCAVSHYDHFIHQRGVLFQLDVQGFAAADGHFCSFVTEETEDQHFVGGQDLDSILSLCIGGSSPGVVTFYDDRSTRNFPPLASVTLPETESPCASATLVPVIAMETTANTLLNRQRMPEGFIL